MRKYVALCHYDGVLKSDAEDLVYIGRERRVVLIVMLLLIFFKNKI